MKYIKLKHLPSFAKWEEISLLPSPKIVAAEWRNKRGRQLTLRAHERQRNRQAAGKPQHNSTLDKLLRQFSNYRRENCAKNYKIIQSVISIPKINTINTRQIRQMILNNTLETISVFKYKIISQNDKMTFPSPRKRVLVKSGRIRNE